MEQFNETEKDFVASVWRKVRVLEYIKAEQELIEQRSHKLMKKKLKVGVTLFLMVSVITIPVFLILGFNIGTLCICGILALIAGSVYEYLENAELNWRNYYGNRNKRLI
jgi:uncharacterized membrane protein (DUF106 family)